MLNMPKRSKAMRQKCFECERLWAVYTEIILRSAELSKSDTASPETHKATNIEWENARTAIIKHMATHKKLT